MEAGFEVAPTNIDELSMSPVELAGDGQSLSCVSSTTSEVEKAQAAINTLTMTDNRALQIFLDRNEGDVMFGSHCNMIKNITINNGKDEIIDPKITKMIQFNTAFILEEMNPEFVLESLKEANIVDEETYSELLNGNRRNKNDKILSILSRGNKNAHETFCNALKTSSQNHMLDHLHRSLCKSCAVCRVNDNIDYLAKNVNPSIMKNVTARCPDLQTKDFNENSASQDDKAKFVHTVASFGEGCLILEDELSVRKLLTWSLDPACAFCTNDTRRAEQRVDSLIEECAICREYSTNIQSNFKLLKTELCFENFKNELIDQKILSKEDCDLISKMERRHMKTGKMITAALTQGADACRSFLQVLKRKGYFRLLQEMHLSHMKTSNTMQGAKMQFDSSLKQYITESISAEELAETLFENKIITIEDLQQVYQNFLGADDLLNLLQRANRKDIEIALIALDLPLQHLTDSLEVTSSAVEGEKSSNYVKADIFIDGTCLLTIPKDVTGNIDMYIKVFGDRSEEIEQRIAEKLRQENDEIKNLIEKMAHLSILDIEEGSILIKFKLQSEESLELLRRSYLNGTLTKVLSEIISLSDTDRIQFQTPFQVVVQISYSGKSMDTELSAFVAMPEEIRQNWNFLGEEMNPVPVLDLLESKNIISKEELSSISLMKRKHQIFSILTLITTRPSVYPVLKQALYENQSHILEHMERKVCTGCTKETISSIKTNIFDNMDWKMICTLLRKSPELKDVILSQCPISALEMKEQILNRILKSDENPTIFEDVWYSRRNLQLESIKCPKCMKIGGKKIRHRHGGLSMSTQSTIEDENVKRPRLSLPDESIYIKENTYGLKQEDFKIIKVIGRGHFDRVEEVVHTPSGTVLAIKRSLIPNPDAEKISTLSHLDRILKTNTSTFTIHHYGSLFVEDTIWILMEKMDTSMERIKTLIYSKTDRIPEEILQFVAHSVVNALHFLHSEVKLVDLDVKPSNILINKTGEVRLSDFGISAKLVDSMTKSVEAGCNPYIAPEVINPPHSNIFSGKLDVWSLGITMIELATGKHPYSSSKNQFENLRQIIMQPVPQLERGKFTEVFRDFVQKCLEKDVDRRISSFDLLTHPFIQTMSMTKEVFSTYIGEIMDRYGDPNEAASRHSMTDYA